MILSKEFYDQCDPSYKKVIDKLENDLADIDGATDGLAIKIQKVLSAITTFSKSYLVPKEYWQHCLDFIKLNNRDAPNFYTYKKLCCGIIKHAYFHLCCVKEWNKLAFQDSDSTTDLMPYADTYLKLDQFHRWHMWDHGITERDISYPHDNLKECRRESERKATKHPSLKLIKRYDEMVKLYPKIKAAENDHEEWYQLLLQVGANDYVINNVEYRLGQNLLNVKLWKIYIGFLEEHGEYKHLLGVYSKYCRLFLDDHEMKKEYEEAMIKYGPIKLSWENLYDFEVHNALEEEKDENQEADSEVQEKSPFDKKICADYYKTRKLQNFSLSGPLVLYILQNAGPLVLQKLFFSCKYFFAKQPTPICYSLHSGSREFYKDESLTIKNDSKQESFPKNLLITGSLFAGRGHIPLIDLLPKIYRCEAKYISLGVLDLSFDELKFLIGHGGVIDLNLMHCKIKDENGLFIDLEKIMAFLPNIVSLKLSRVKTNAKTGHALAEQKFSSKISSINVHQIFGVPFDIDEFLKFLTANKDDEHDFSGEFYFNKDFDAAFVEYLGQILSGYSKSREDDCITAEFDYWE